MDDFVVLVTVPFFCFVLRGTKAVVVLVSFVSVGVNFSASLGPASPTPPFPTLESPLPPVFPPFTANFVLFGGGNIENKPPPPPSGRGLFLTDTSSSFGALAGFGRSTRICFFVEFGRVACWGSGAKGGGGALSSESSLSDSDE